jgi:hypothetical protein
MSMDSQKRATTPKPLIAELIRLEKTTAQAGAGCKKTAAIEAGGRRAVEHGQSSLIRSRRSAGCGCLPVGGVSRDSKVMNSLHLLHRGIGLDNKSASAIGCGVHEGAPFTWRAISAAASP